MSYLSKYIDLVVKLNIIREKLIRYKMIQSIVLLNLWLVIKLIFSIENIFKVLFFLWLLIFRLDFKNLNRSLQRCCISDFDLLRLKLLSNQSLLVLIVNWRCNNLALDLLNINFIVILFPFHLRLMLLADLMYILTVLLLIATAITLILNDIGKYLAPYLPVIILVDDSLSQYNFINVLFTQDSELSLDDSFVILQLSDYVCCGDLPLFVGVLYVVVLFTRL